jgi:hypothetical protein
LRHYNDLGQGSCQIRQPSGGGDQQINVGRAIHHGHRLPAPLGMRQLRDGRDPITAALD